MIDITTMLEKMYRLSVWDARGKQFLPVFTRDRTGEVEFYTWAPDAIMLNVQEWRPL